MSAGVGVIEIKLLEKLHSTIDKCVQELRIKNDADIIKNNDENNEVLVNYTKLLRFAQDIDRIRRKTYNADNLQMFNKDLHKTDRDIQNLLLIFELQIDKLHQEKIDLDKEILDKKAKDEISQDLNETNNNQIEMINSSGKFEDFQNEESIETLKSRLLKTNHSQLDQIQTTEIQNNYHDSIQQELIDSLPSMVSSLKEQALQFQEMIIQDAVILKEATQKFETSHGKFDNVNTLLSKYHKEGRLGFWFYIRIISLVLVSFLFLLIIIRLIPARH
jgi:SNARE protein 1